MIETLLALVPDYGLFLIFGVVLLGCLAVPLPGSMLVLAAGSFAAAGDLSLGQLVLVTFAAFAVGDQIAYGLSRRAGPAVRRTLESRPRLAPVVTRSTRLIETRGPLAVFLSHTVVSPTCPYVSYLSGAGGMGWARYSVPALAGAVVWTAVYIGAGYVFASQLEQIATLLSNFFGVILAAGVALGSVLLIRSRWRAAHPPVDAP